MIPEFNINRSEPQPMLNRAFLWQVMISSEQNFTRTAPLIENLYGHRLEHYIPMVISDGPSGQTSNIPDIRGLSNEDVLAILTHEKIDLLPQFFFWFGKKNIAGTDDFMNFPELYTGIEQVSFDKGGLILMKRGEDSKRLFTGRGVPLTQLTAYLKGYYYEKIRLGIRGVVSIDFYDEMRQEGFEKLCILNNTSLKELDTFELGSWNPVSATGKYIDIYSDTYFFPEGYSSIARDVIEEMLPDGEKIATSLDISQPVTGPQLDEELQHNPHAEIFLRDHYADSKRLAAIVLKHKPIAYSCLSRKLQNDRNFIIEVIKKHKLYELHPFLRRKLREDMEIAALCKPFGPDGPDLPF